MIELRNFTKAYGDFVAVANLNLKIAAGEMFGFIGPNGAGKSTTIRFLATLLRATAGEGIVNGHSVTQDPLGVRKSIGYMPDNFGVYDGMKVWEFLDFFAVAYEIPKSRRKAVIGDVLELLDLTHKRDDFVNGLSRGMKQRLCLAKTLVHDPPVLILDEPASGLDPRARLEVKALLKELRSMGKTILISSHILHELAQFCTHVGILETGRIVASGPLHEIYRTLALDRAIHCTLAGPAAPWVEQIKAIPGVASVQELPDRLLIRLREGEMVPEDLLDAIRALGTKIRMFQPDAVDMETAFMKLTEGKTA
jgi:ABC-2 type transport system ATP-binding protein